MNCRRFSQPIVTESRAGGTTYHSMSAGEEPSPSRGFEILTDSEVFLTNKIGFGWFIVCNCGSSANKVLRINACIAICCLLFSVPGCSGKGTLSSEVSALAHRAMPTRIEYHVLQSRGYIVHPAFAHIRRCVVAGDSRSLT